MRCSSNDRPPRRQRLPALAVILVAAALAATGGPPAPEPANLLRNGGFEENRGAGTVPDGWGFVDETRDAVGWTAPRAERSIGGIGPRSGRFLAGCDTEMMGVDTNGKADDVPRSALFQTIRVPSGSRGIFSVYYNDIGSTALGHVSALRLAFTVNGAAIDSIRVPREVQGNRLGDGPGARGPSPGLRPGEWSRPFYRVSQRLSSNPQGRGDWTLASIPVAVGEQGGERALTLWIGIFDNQDSTEIGYWRIDDASFVIARR